MQCAICREALPPELVQEHHAVPQSVGRKPDDSERNLIRLCSGCHHDLHRIAERILKGATSRATDLAGGKFPGDSGAQRRMLHYAELVAVEMRAMREGERDLPETVKVTIEMPRHLFNQLRIMSMEANGGNTRGLQPFLRMTLALVARKHFAEQGSREPKLMPNPSKTVSGVEAAGLVKKPRRRVVRDLSQTITG